MPPKSTSKRKSAASATVTPHLDLFAGTPVLTGRETARYQKAQARWEQARIENPATDSHRLVAAARRDPVAAARRDPVAAARRDLVPAARRDLVPAARRELVPTARRDPVARWNYTR
jgi:hypothetical protein